VQRNAYESPLGKGRKGDKPRPRKRAVDTAVSRVKIWPRDRAVPAKSKTSRMGKKVQRTDTVPTGQRQGIEKIDRGDTHVAWIQFEKVKLRPAMSEPAQAGMLKRSRGVETPSSTGRGTTGIGSGARSTDEIEFSGQSDEYR